MVALASCALSGVLTTAREVHDLPPTAARLGHQIHLRAVVTYFDPANHLLFVADGTDGIFVELSDLEGVSLRAGDEVDVTGVSGPDFAPNVDKAHVGFLRHTHLPAPGPGDFETAIRGREDCHWIELGGIIQQVAPGHADALVTLSSGRDTYKAHVLAAPDDLASLVDAEVKVRGVCGALFNPKHQMLGIQMFVPAKECIRVLRPPPPDPFSMAITPIQDLMLFSRTADLGHRVRVRGTVTYGNLAGSTWIRDSTGGLMIREHDAEKLAAGDVVDVLGFPTSAGYSPTLGGAQVKKLQSGAPPAAARIAAQDAMDGRFDGQLVQIEGTLVERLQRPTEQILTIQSGGTVFSASLPIGVAAPVLEPGTVLRLTGICAVEVEQSYYFILPRGFRLLLRSPADAVILSKPPWLTADRVVPILAGVGLLMLAAVGWAVLLRKRVGAQTNALRAQTIQLQAAHLSTRRALEQVCAAEALDVDSKNILELIARDEPADLIVDRIAEAVALHAEGAVCAILLASLEGSRVCAVPALPSCWLEILGGIQMSSISFSPQFRDPREFTDNPAWAGFLASQPGTRFKAFCSAPIVVESTTVGAIVAFFRYAKPSAEARDETLGLWSNIAALALERRRLHDRLSHRAQHDTLTGLPNRALLYERLEAEIAAASRGGHLLGVLYIDLDSFKTTNDTYGHDAGDTVLEHAARRMAHSVRRGDTVGRIGGDEFVVLLPQVGRREDAEHIAAKISAALREPIDAQHQRLSISASVGIAVWPSDGDRPDALLRFADAQMYGAKRQLRRHAKERSSPDRPRQVVA
jgi:diguanylate cyclase (GGDEF)-like protein